MKTRKKKIFVLATVFVAAIMLMTACMGSESEGIAKTPTPIPTPLPDISKEGAAEELAAEIINRKKEEKAATEEEATEEVTGSKVANTQVAEQTEFTLTNQLPIIYINTENGVSISSKEEYIRGTLSTSNAKEKQIITDVGMSIRLRGNKSLEFEKASYKIKLDKSAKLLGVGDGKAKQWCLISNHCDQSLLRNFVAYKLLRKLDKIGWSPDCKNVDVVVNGKYMGVYLLVEQIKEDPNRVVISEDTEAGEDIGFLFMMTKKPDDGEVFQIKGLPTFVIKSDLSENAELKKKQVQYIQSYVKKCYLAIQSCDEEEIEKLIDIDSAVDIYILEEFLMNIDVGYDSFYFTKDAGGKLVFGPVWDFDLAMGNDERLYNGAYEGLYVGRRDAQFYQQNEFFLGLCEQDWFAEKVCARWDEVKDIFKGAGEMVAKEYAKAPAAYNLNFERWQIFGQQINMEPQVIRALNTHVAHKDYLIDWLNNRYKEMDKMF